MPKKKSFTTDEVKKITEDAAKKGAAQALLEKETQDTEIEFNGAGAEAGLFTPELDEELQDEDDFLTHCKNKYEKQGVFADVIIKKNGSFVAEVPLSGLQSLSDIQKLYGGGLYVLIARDSVTKRYLKKNTVRIDEIHKDAPTPQATSNPTTQTVPIQSQLQPQQPSYESLLHFVQSVQATAAQDKRIEAREEKRASDSFTTQIFSLISEQQKTSQQMFMTLAENMNKQTQALQESTAKMIEKITDRMEKQIQAITATKKDDGYSAKEILDMQLKAEDRGWAKFEKFMQLAEKKAKEIAKDTDSDDEDNSTGGLITQFAKAMLPIVTHTAGQIAGQPGAHPMMMPQPQPPPEVAAAQVARTQPPELLRRPQNLKPVPKAANPLFTDKPKAQEIPKAPDKISVDDLVKIASVEQMHIASAAAPILKQAFESNLKALDAASLLVAEFSRLGLSTEHVLKHFTYQFMLKAVDATFGVQGREIWLKEFYAHLKNSTRVAASGSPVHP